MTDYNKKLDKILWSAIMHEPAPTKPGQEYKATWNEPVIKKAKQSLTSLTKELVADAKPEKRITEADKLRSQGRRIVGSSPFVDVENDAFNAAINQFEQNLLKVLEEVK